MGAGASERAVVSLVYYLTEACNMRCTYCYVQKRPRRSSLEVGRAVVDFLLDASAGREDVHLRFTGGEPLLEFDLMEAVIGYGVEQASKAGRRIHFDVFTNGTLLHADALDRLEALGVPAIVSVDGTRETMAANRPVQAQDMDGFEEKLRCATARGVARTARMTVSPIQEDIVEDVRFLRDLGFGSIWVCLAANVPWRAEAIGRIYKGLASFYVESARAGQILPLKITNNLLTTRHEIEQGTHVRVGEGFCGAGGELLGVSTCGELYPCQRFVQLGAQFCLGHVVTGLEGENREPFLGNKPFHSPECQACEALLYCPGSCMAANFRSTGKLFSPEERHCRELRAHVRAVEYIYDTLMEEGCDVLRSFLERRWEARRKQRLAVLLEEALGNQWGDCPREDPR